MATQRGQGWGRLPHQLVKGLVIALLAAAYLLFCLLEYLADLREQGGRKQGRSHD